MILLPPKGHLHFPKVICSTRLERSQTIPLSVYFAFQASLPCKENPDKINYNVESVCCISTEYLNVWILIKWERLVWLTPCTWPTYTHNSMGSHNRMGSSKHIRTNMGRPLVKSDCWPLHMYVCSLLKSHFLKVSNKLFTLMGSVRTFAATANHYIH